MRYSFRDRVARDYDEQFFLWKDIPAWEEKWARLSPRARQSYLEKVRAPAGQGNQTRPFTNPGALHPDIVRELLQAGFIEMCSTIAKKPMPRIAVHVAAIPFTARVRHLLRYGLLTHECLENLTHYCRQFFLEQGLRTRLVKVMLAGKKKWPVEIQMDFLQKYILRARWSEWTRQMLRDAIVDDVWAVIASSAEPITHADLRAGLPNRTPDQINGAVRTLLGHLALFEGVREESWELVLGIPPTVREEYGRALSPAARPALEACAAMEQTAPTGGLQIEDLRVVLLEIADEPPRLKVQGDLFQKEEQRLLDALPVWPDWLTTFSQSSSARRLRQAILLAHDMALTAQDDKGGEYRLRLSKRGGAWLAASAAQQFHAVYAFYARFSEDQRQDYYQCHSDRVFLGADIRVILGDPSERSVYSSWELPKERRQALRDSLWQAWDVLKPGQFYRLDSVPKHLCHGEANPLLTGKKPNQVAVFSSTYRVIDPEDDLEPAASGFLETHIRERLIPLGCMAVGVDSEGRIGVARHARLDAYYGKGKLTAENADEAAHGAKVVVQPDFSVVIIGMNPAPAVELAPFCERVKGRAGQGSITLRITRDSVMKAVHHGLSAQEILQRLRKHAHNELPKNVVHEVTEWSSWVRQVTVRMLTVVTCPDAETTARVMSALRTKAERLSDTAVGLDVDRLTSAQRAALKKHGVVVAEYASADANPAHAKDRGRADEWDHAYEYDD